MGWRLCAWTLTASAVLALIGCSPNDREKSSALESHLQSLPGVESVVVTYQDTPMQVVAVEVSMPNAVDGQVASVGHELSASMLADFADAYHPLTIRLSPQVTLGALRFRPGETEDGVRIARQLEASVEAQSIYVSLDADVPVIDIAGAADSFHAVSVAAKAMGFRDGLVRVDIPRSDFPQGQVLWDVRAPATQAQLDAVYAEVQKEPEAFSVEVRDGRLTDLRVLDLP